MSIHFELKEIPVPKNARSDGSRVYVKADAGSGSGVKVYIGVYARKDEGTFYPNDRYRYYFPSEWQKYYGADDLHPHILGVGLYGATLAASHQLGLYDIIYSRFGPLYGNGLLDYAMYSIRERSNVANLFRPAMAFSALFSKDRNDDGWYSDVFAHRITKEMIHGFREDWIGRCRDSGVRSVWLAVDGSNSNCEADSDLACPGKAKSHESKPIVSYIWAVSTEDGMPVTFFMNEGSTADSKAFGEICAFIRGHGLEIKGVILDRGFLTHGVIKMITDAGYDYVVKLKSSTRALTEMLEQHRQLISWNPEYLVGKGARFGVATKEPVRLFASGDDQAYVAMYFDGKNGSERRVALADKMFAAMEKARQQAQAGIMPRIDDAMSAYLALEEITGSEDGIMQNNNDNKHAVEGSSWIIDCGEKRYRIAARKASVEKALRQKGIDGLASSRKMTAREMDEIYNLRDISEKQYMISKSMLGNKVFRAHSTQAIEAREAACFIAAIIRSTILNACRRNGANTGRMIESMDEKAYLLLMPGQKYTFINKLTDAMKKVFRSLGLMPSDFETIAGDINERIRTGGIGVSQYHEMPEDIRLRHKKKHIRNDQRENEKTESKKEKKAVRTNEKKSKSLVKRSPGRPKGSRNKKTCRKQRFKAKKETDKGTDSC